MISWLFWIRISAFTLSMWKSCSSLVLDLCLALWCIGFQIFSGFFILYRFCICFHGFFVQNHDLVFQLGYVKIMLELDSGLLLGPRGPPDFRNFNKSWIYIGFPIVFNDFPIKNNGFFLLPLGFACILAQKSQDFQHLCTDFIKKYKKSSSARSSLRDFWTYFRAFGAKKH